MSNVIIENATKYYGEFAAVKNVSFEIKEGEFVSLLGPSGCGKTTSLRIIAGLEDLDEGSVLIAGQNMTDVPVFKRNIGLMFQDYALFPHMTVQDNVAFGLKMRHMPPGEIKEQISWVLKLVGLENLGHRMPHELSGGQQQRVALARTLVVQPRVLLLDEPLSNLDAKVRKEMRLEIRRIQRELGITTILVTHDQEEALSVSDRIIVMRKGAIIEEGTPLDIYNRPQNEFVANFMGQTNIIRGCIARRSDGLLAVSAGETGSLNLHLRAEQAPPDQQEEVVFMIPRETLRVCPAGFAGEEGFDTIDSIVESASYEGGRIQYQCRADGIRFAFSQPVREDLAGRQAGEKVMLAFPPSEVCFLKQSEPE